jgi:hypothetical protein
MNEIQTKLIALALYQLRIILSTVGEDAPHEVRLAWRLAYALHNDAWAIVEGKSFDVEATLARIEHIDHVISGNEGRQIADQFREVLFKNPNSG